MAEKKTVTAAENERVIVHPDRAPSNEDPNLFISVNGVNYLLVRGKDNEVPPEVAYEYNRAKKAMDAFNETVDRLKA